MEIFGRKASEQHGVNMVTAVAMSAFHGLAVAAFFVFSWKAAVAAFLMWWISGGWGIGMGYHRLLTHRGFKCPKWVEYVLTTCGTLALEGGPIFWVGTHRVHHQLSDKEGDPHTPREGGLWAHMGWIIKGVPLHDKIKEVSRYVPDLRNDRFHVWLTEWHWIPQVIVGVMLAAIGYALGGVREMAAFVLWAVFFRVTFLLHCTWLVNSATHMWGSRRFQTKDDSTNNWWVALITFGEGWHNNHHAHPISARHGIAWYEFDINWICISFLRMIGLAWDVKTVRPTQPMPVAADPAPVAQPEREPELVGAYD